jgi:predicted ATPase
MSKIPYYTIDRIKKENAQINLIIGERSNGKSYQVKHEEAIYPFINSYNKLKKEGILESAYNKLDRFFLLRRLEAEIKNSFVEKYFNDVDIY